MDERTVNNIRKNILRIMESDCLAGTIFLKRYQFCGRIPAFHLSEASCEHDGPRGVVLFTIRAVNGVLQTFAPGLNGANGYFATGDFDCPTRFLKKCPVPTSGLQAPRPYKHATFH